MKLIDYIKGNFVDFDSYRKGVFIYIVSVNDIKYQFPVPADDVGDGTLLKRDKATFFQRWIRKAIENNELIEVK